MDAATSAALIGASVGAISSLAAQFLFHRLSLSRDRRSQIREQRLAAVEKAALLLAGTENSGDPPDADEKGILGQHPEVWPLVEGLSEAVAVLQVHFGTDHPIVRSYTDTWAICADAKVQISKSTKIARDRLRGKSAPTASEVDQAAGNEIAASAKAAVAALNARDAWMKEALRAVRKT